MKTATKPLVLRAETAAELMTPNPVSLSDEAFVSEAVALLTERGFSAAPVIDAAGRPVGVVSRTDLLIHDREQCGLPVPTAWDEEPPAAGFQVKQIDATLVRDVMTPVVFCVAPDDGAECVVNQLLGLKVHHLFVVDADGVLVGVISAQDVLKFLGR
jgi:CBS-domain-containing membrane protein